MATASYKDKLLDKFQEFDIAQQTLDRTRSEMHCIIAALPGENKPKEITISSAHFRERPIVIKHQNDGESGKPVPPHMLRNLDEDEWKRPVVITSEPDSTESNRDLEPDRPKKTRAKRVSEADIRKAIKLVYDDNLTQKQAEKMCNLPHGTLSRRKGKRVMEEYRKEWGTPTSLYSQHGVSKKELEKAFLYDD